MSSLPPKDALNSPPGNKIKLLSSSDSEASILIKREGLSLRSGFILTVILFWLLMIAVWAFMLFQYGPAWSLLSLPFFALGILTLYTTLQMIRNHQRIEIINGNVYIYKTSGKVTAHAELSLKNISDISMVEGTYKTLAGISRKGIYPAFITNGEAYGVAERCRKFEKQWLLEFLKQFTAKQVATHEK